MMFSWPTLDSEILALETKAGNATGVRVSESDHEGICDSWADALHKAKLGQKSAHLATLLQKHVLFCVRTCSIHEIH